MQNNQLDLFQMEGKLHTYFVVVSKQDNQCHGK